MTIRLIITDIDGVWTDGRIIYDSENREIKEFHVRDGLGVRLAQKANVTVAVVTSRESKAVERRCRELGITEISQGASDKMREVTAIADRLGVPLSEACYIGDDLPDLAPMRACGLSAAPADASDEALDAAIIRLKLPGGRGAFRELVEIVLRQNGTWDTIVADYRS